MCDLVISGPTYRAVNVNGSLVTNEMSLSVAMQQQQIKTCQRESNNNRVCVGLNHVGDSQCHDLHALNRSSGHG